MPPDAEALHLDDIGRFNYRTKLILYAAGTAVFFASLAYLGHRIAGQWHSLENTHIDRSGWFAASVVIYGMSHISTGLAWPNALRVVGERITLRDGLKIGLVAQIGKYLPGNVAHYFGRAGLGKSFGISFRGSGLSTLVEIACALVASVLLAPGALVAGHGVELSGVLFAAVMALVTLATMAVLALWKIERNERFASLSAFIVAALCITISLFLSGASAYCLLVSIGTTSVPLIYVVGAFALAWIGGLLTPGAPGGLGVRETIFVTLIGGQVAASAALACAILHRLITAVVDFMAAVLGYAWLASGSRSNT